ADQHVQVAADALAALRDLGRGRLALGLDADGLTVLDARRDLDRQRAFLGHSPLPAAALAELLDDLPAPVTRRARGDHAEHAPQAGLLHAPLAAARGALDGLAAGLGARAGAGLADIEPGELDIALGARVDLFERDLDLGLEVKPAGNAA